MKNSYIASIEVEKSNILHVDSKKDHKLKSGRIQGTSYKQNEENAFAFSSDEEEREKEIETITLYSKDRLVKPHPGIKVSQKFIYFESEISINQARDKENDKSFFRSRSPKRYKKTKVRWQSENNSPIHCHIGKRTESPTAKNLINNHLKSDFDQDYENTSNDSKMGKLDTLKDFDFGTKSSTLSSIETNSRFIALGSMIKEFGLKSWHYLSKHNDVKNQYNMVNIGKRQGSHHNAIITDPETFREELLWEVKKTVKAIADGNITRSIMELMVDKNTGRILKTEDIICRIVSSKAQALASRVRMQPCKPVKLVVQPKQKISTRGIIMLLNNRSFSFDS
ncbi:unnamed protein product [Spodoptera littoralis]|uniref:Uncharacterized protein n=1 Tax=Spodoptera littoralis TaxID=7109 RepID=A0A9P0N7N6_SPOLI|nr:unnamed protein product [Spodoptera littoralis]